MTAPAPQKLIRADMQPDSNKRNQKKKPSGKKFGKIKNDPLKLEDGANATETQWRNVGEE